MARKIPTLSDQVVSILGTLPQCTLADNVSGRVNGMLRAMLKNRFNRIVTDGTLTGTLITMEKRGLITRHTGKTKTYSIALTNAQTKSLLSTISLRELDEMTELLNGHLTDVLRTHATALLTISRARELILASQSSLTK